jgi:F-type H+-transporting ATPase subunit b
MLLHLLADGPANPDEINPVIPIWQEILIGSIAFGLLCWVLMKYVFPRMEQTFQARVDAIEGGIARAETAQAEAAQALAQYREQLAGARAEAATIRDEARADAAAIREDVLTKAREESDRIIAAGKDQLQAERAGIVRELRGQMGTLAVNLAGRIVGESLEDETRRKGTVDRFLADLESNGAGAR